MEKSGEYRWGMGRSACGEERGWTRVKRGLMCAMGSIFERSRFCGWIVIITYTESCVDMPRDCAEYIPGVLTISSSIHLRPSILKDSTRRIPPKQDSRSVWFLIHIRRLLGRKPLSYSNLPTRNFYVIQLS
ncbi:hypothetical protein Tco_1556117 [Tanacetum coccineum]